MTSLVRPLFLYFQLLWHHLVYVTAVTEPERFHSNLGITYFHLGSFRKAIAHLEKSEELRHGDDRGFARYDSFYLGLCFMNLDECLEAIRHLEDYLRLKPDDQHIKESIDWCRRQLPQEEQSKRCA